MAVTSAWRVNDVVAYDAMRESATQLTAQLLKSADHDSTGPEEAQAEMALLRQGVLGVDGYNRAAVVALARRIDGRISDLSREPS